MNNQESFLVRRQRLCRRLSVPMWFMILAVTLMLGDIPLNGFLEHFMFHKPLAVAVVFFLSCLIFVVTLLLGLIAGFRWLSLLIPGTAMLLGGAIGCWLFGFDRSLSARVIFLAGLGLVLLSVAIWSWFDKMRCGPTEGEGGLL